MTQFTVNIAVYNQLESLKLILEALEHQTFKDFEIIVCDDGSSDGTKEWCEEQDFKYFWQEDRGFRLAKSKNNGIREATGEYFVSLEGDVIPHFRLLEEYRMWVKPNILCLGVRHDIEKLPDKIDFDLLDSTIVSRDWRSDALIHIGKTDKPWRMCSGCNMCVHTQTLQDIGGWNENFKHYGIDDYEVALRLHASGCEIIAVPGAYGYHLRHDIRETSDENMKLLEEAEERYASSN